MKKLIAGALLALAAAGAWAACSFNSIVTADGRVVICSTCCDDNGTNCVTVCQ